MWSDIKLKLKWWLGSSQVKSRGKTIIGKDNHMSNGSEVGVSEVLMLWKVDVSETY